MSKCMRFPTMWCVRPAKPQISLHMRAVWSEPLLVAWVFYDCKATDWTQFGVSKNNRRLWRLVSVYTCQNVKLLEMSCTGSNIVLFLYKTIQNCSYLLLMVKTISHSSNTHIKSLLSVSASVVITIITHLLPTSRIITQYFNHMMLYNLSPVHSKSMRHHQLSNYAIHGLEHSENDMNAW